MKHSGFKNMVYTFVAGFLVLVAVFAAWQIFSILHATSTAKKAYSELAAEAAGSEDFAQKDPLQRSFDWPLLQKSYPGIVGWLSDPEGSIDYPIMQAEDNDYYLTHLPGGTQNNHGSLFLDCNGSSDFADWNNLVYGHNMKDGTMLACLTEYAQQSYYDAHPALILYTPAGNYSLPVLSAYETTAASNAYRQGGTADDHAAWLQEIGAKSAVSVQDCGEQTPLVLTLSTCINGIDNSDKRFVVHLALLPAAQE